MVLPLFPFTCVYILLLCTLWPYVRLAFPKFVVTDPPIAHDRKYLATCKNIFAIWGSKNASIFTKILLEMDHMYKSYRLKNYDNRYKTMVVAILYISGFIFINFILKPIKKVLENWLFLLKWSEFRFEIFTTAC